MSFEAKLEQKAKEATYLSISELKESITAKMVKQEFKNDKRANENLYITLELQQPVPNLVVQKYGKSLYAKLGEAVKVCGGEKALMAEFLVWKQEKAGRAQFNRYFPQVSTKKTK